MSGTYIPLRTALGARRARGHGSRALLFTLECALGIVAVVLVAALAHWFQWLLPVSALLCLLIVVPTALAVRILAGGHRFAFGGGGAELL